MKIKFLFYRCLTCPKLSLRFLTSALKAVGNCAPLTSDSFSNNAELNQLRLVVYSRLPLKICDRIAACYGGNAEAYDLWGAEWLELESVVTALMTANFWQGAESSRSIMNAAFERYVCWQPALDFN